ncbi:MAG TPA: SdpI family protein [Terriglobia bacterium]|nr:SdpI family protein [Terriglobia bacterium]
MIRQGILVSLVAVLLIASLFGWAAAGAAPGVRFSIAELVANDGRLVGSAALTVLALLAPLAAGFALLFVMLPRIAPLRENLERGSRPYLIAWAGIQLLLLALAWSLATGIRSAAPGGSAEIGWRFAMAIGCATLVLVADLLPKTRRNFVFGVLTPWTLSSDLAWEKTHRLAGRLFMLIGIAGLVSSFALDPEALLLTFVLPAVAAALWCVVYSYAVWRSDAGRLRGELEDE